MADQSWHSHDVQLAVADDLVGDIHAVALDVPRLGCGGIAFNRAHTPLLPQPGQDTAQPTPHGASSQAQVPVIANRPEHGQGRVLAGAQPLVQGQVHAVGLAMAYKLIEAAQTC